MKKITNTKRKRIIVFCSVIIIVLVVALAILLSWNHVILKKSLTSFTEIVSEENLDDLTLTIYYIDPWILTLAPLGVEDLIDGGEGINKVIVKGSNLEEHIVQLKMMCKTNFKPISISPAKRFNREDARVHYVFESKTYGKVLDVTLGGYTVTANIGRLFITKDGILLNGILIDDIDIFYNFIAQYSSEDKPIFLVDYLE